MDTDEVFAVTSGNPFFVAEVFASGDIGGVPHTVTEAVRARLADLDGTTRDAVEQLAVIPSASERWLVDAVVPGGLASLTVAERRGVLTVHPTRVAFAHELARRAVVESMPAARRVACNQAVLSALLDRREGVDLSRIVHHAARAGADEVIVSHGPAAAREAAAAGSHREAVAHYRLVLEHRQVFPPEVRADLLDEYAVECHTVGLSEVGVPAQEEAVRLRRTLGDPRKLGLSLRWLSRIHWWAGARAQAETAGAEAIEVLEAAGDRRALAMALSNQSQLHMLGGRRRECITVGRRAVTMARELGDAALLSHALNNVGTALWDDGVPEGQAMLEESLSVALAAGEAEHACRAYVNIAWHLIDVLRFAEAERILEDALELADEGEFDGFRRYLQVTRSMVYLSRGRWEEAEREIRWALDAEPIIRCPALVVLGTVQARRGQEGAAQLLEQAWQIARQLGEAQRTGPAGAALLEAAWLRGDASRVASVVAPAYDDVRHFGRLSARAAFGYWMRAAGQAVPVNGSEHPYTLLADGHWREAAEAWRRADCPYEHALARAHSADPADLLSALATLTALGAEPLARRVRHRLRELGVVHIPRGQVQSTRDSPAGLTERQTDVVRLMAEGLTNAEIAARLVLSVRTVDTHVGAILNKLAARTRRDAVARAKALGLVDLHAGFSGTS
jgi:DNA-binding CsgD family transcriptional regulator/tetratricopeptide (TPR) repeat protein